MAGGVREFFEGLATRVDPSRTAGVSGTYVFEIDGAGTWTVAIEDGAVSVAEGARPADCTIVASAESFERIIGGRQNPTTAFMTGKLKIEGDLGAAMKLQNLF